jgi:hypothetical protein
VVIYNTTMSQTSRDTEPMPMCQLQQYFCNMCPICVLLGMAMWMCITLVIKWCRRSIKSVQADLRCPSSRSRRQTFRSSTQHHSGKVAVVFAPSSLSRFSKPEGRTSSLSRLRLSTSTCTQMLPSASCCRQFNSVLL